MTIRTLAVAAVFLASTGIANAASITYFDTHTREGIRFDIWGWTQTLRLAQFHPDLGTLNSATLTVEGTVQADIGLENKTNLPQDSAAFATYEFVTARVPLTAPFSPILANVSASARFDAAAYDGTTDFDGPSGRKFFNVLGTGAKSDVYSDPADLTAFIGTGVMDFYTSATTLSDATPGVDLSFTGTSRGQISVTYDFDPAVTPVPLPAGAPLLLAGLGAFAVARRMKKKPS